MERRAAVVARQVDVGARADEVRDARDVPLLARDVERAAPWPPVAVQVGARSSSSATITRGRAAPPTGAACPARWRRARSPAPGAGYGGMSSSASQAPPAATVRRAARGLR